MFHFLKSPKIVFALLLAFNLLLVPPVIAVNGDEQAAKLAWPMIESGALLVDVRSAEEFAEGHIDGAVNIVWDDTAALIAAIGEDKQRPVVFYCRSGNRVGKSIVVLGTKGYNNIYNATGLEALLATKP
jgi:phage shock protein E